MTLGTYEYDPLGRRSEKTASGVTTEYLHAGAQVLAEYDGGGDLVRRYVYGPGIDDPVAVLNEAGNVTYFHGDGLGSIIALSDAAGANIDIFTHGPFGGLDTNSGGSALKYTARRIDEETGLYYYRNRYYHPDMGRFLTADPIGYGGGLNMYAYVGNDPMNFTDPSGLVKADEEEKQCTNTCRGFSLSPQMRLSFGPSGGGGGTKGTNQGRGKKDNDAPNPSAAADGVEEIVVTGTRGGLFGSFADFQSFAGIEEIIVTARRRQPSIRRFSLGTETFLSVPSTETQILQFLGLLQLDNCLTFGFCPFNETAESTINGLFLLAPIKGLGALKGLKLKDVAKSVKSFTVSLGQFLGPRGPVFGAGRLRPGLGAGILNKGIVRFGFTPHQGFFRLGFRIGNRHLFDLPFIRIKIPGG